MRQALENWPPRPEGTRLLGVYRRRLLSSVEGVWRNVADFAHLPWVHGHAFAGIDLLESGDDWWRAKVTLAPASLAQTMVLELTIDREGSRYVTRTLAGVSAGGYILTKLLPIDDAHTQIEVEFWGKAKSPEQAAGLVKGYLSLYEKLWDEDEAMIVDMLAADKHQPWKPVAGTQFRIINSRTVSSTADDQTRLGLAEHGGQLFIHEPVCPHMGGSLLGAKVDAEGRLHCPWHDFRFSLVDGGCDRSSGLVLPCRRARRLERDTVEI